MEPDRQNRPCDGTNITLRNFCGQEGGVEDLENPNTTIDWQRKKYCRLACFEIGLGYPGDDCSDGAYKQKEMCSYTNERVRYTTAAETCASEGLGLPDVTDTVPAIDTCRYGRGSDRRTDFIWTTEDCSISIVVDETGRVASQIDDTTKQNFFQVYWVNGTFPEPGVHTLSVEVKPVFHTLPNVGLLGLEAQGRRVPPRGCSSAGGRHSAGLPAGWHVR